MVCLIPFALSYRNSIRHVSHTLVFKELISGQRNVPASALPLHDMILLTFIHYEPAPDPIIKRFKNTFSILLTYLASELSEDGSFIDLSPHPLLQGLEAYFFCVFLNVLFSLNGSFLISSTSD